MLELEGLNYWAIAAAWVVNCAVGALWYSPSGFAKKWEEYTGIDIMKMPNNEATKTLGFVILSGLVQAVTLAVVLNSLEVTEVMNALVIGTVLWLGFTAATTVGVTHYSQRSWKFWWLNASYFLVVMLINSVMLATWR